MNAQLTALTALLANPDVQISRIEIEILPPDRFRWILCDGPRRLFAAVSDRNDLAAMIRSTELLVGAELGLPPECESPIPGLN